MAREQLKNLTEPMYYLLLALITPQHGYSIMQSIAEVTENRVQVGAGTLYALLSRFESEQIITQIMEKDRKKIYQITPKGAEVLEEEFRRLNQMVEDGKRFFDGGGTMLPIHYEEVRQEEEQTQAATAGASKDAQVDRPAEKPEEKPKGKSKGKPEEKPETEDGGKVPEQHGGEEEKPGKQAAEKGEKQRFGRGFRKGIFAT